ncbi:MAG TPA: class I SAM-dependent methyltransferase [Stellaceae bacterium]|nr:class I SAM-dependent methyltransferase [Stellaceae bacterium]
MDERIMAVLAEYAERAAREQVLMQTLSFEELSGRVDELLIHVGEVVAHFLNALIKARQATRILELGTSYGFSSLFLAEAARETGGRVVTTELSAKKIAHARAMAEKAGLAEYIDYREGDARATIAALPGPFDFVLVDLWKDLYIPCFDLFHPKLAPGAIVVADNMIEPEFSRDDGLAYRRHVHATPGMESVLLPLGQGIEVSRHAGGGLDAWGIFPT